MVRKRSSRALQPWRGAINLKDNIRFASRRVRAPAPRSACECDSELALLFSLSSAFAILGIFAAAANGCLQKGDLQRSVGRHQFPVVVPVGSLQSEIGINVSAPDGTRILDGTNSRLRWAWRLA
jgi:hypothetical protein